MNENQNTKEKGVLSKLLRCAVANGGDRLDAFGEGLFNKYQKNGSFFHNYQTSIYNIILIYNH